MSRRSSVVPQLAFGAAVGVIAYLVLRQRGRPPQVVLQEHRSLTALRGQVASQQPQTRAEQSSQKAELQGIDSRLAQIRREIEDLQMGIRPGRTERLPGRV